MRLSFTHRRRIKPDDSVSFLTSHTPDKRSNVSDLVDEKLLLEATFRPKKCDYVLLRSYRYDKYRVGAENSAGLIRAL